MSLRRVIFLSNILVRRWSGVVIILACTLLFFSPYIVRIDSYSEGGDAMFNAWLLSRTHHCLLRQDCPNYLDGNIFYPHKDSMLFSETQLSAGLLTLPLHFINPHPILAFNFWTITQFFLCGLCMYLLAKKLSQNHELISIASGLIFAFAPMRIAVIAHMQNASIFYLPLIILLLLTFLETKKYRWLIVLFITLVLFFYASWYLMVFGLIALSVFLVTLRLFTLAETRLIGALSGVIILAIAATLPLTKEYVRFSRENNARFSVIDQMTYSSSLIDYFIPQLGTIFGTLLRHPRAHIQAINPDSVSYHGLILYAVAIFLLTTVLVSRKNPKQFDRDAKLIVMFVLLALVGLIVSLGPYLKVFASATYHLPNGFDYRIPLPYLFLDKLLPQLSFIRAIGRASMLTLFSLCCLLAILPLQLKKIATSKNTRTGVVGLVLAVVIVELMPLHRVPMAKGAYAYNLHIPKVYKFIKAHIEIDNLIVLHADPDYPGVLWKVIEPEEAMWAGYANRRIFNGYSGYFPPSYQADLAFFATLEPEVVPKMKRYGLEYVVIDKLLSSSRPDFLSKAEELLPNKIYEDDRYVICKI